MLAVACMIQQDFTHTFIIHMMSKEIWQRTHRYRAPAFVIVSIFALIQIFS